MLISYLKIADSVSKNPKLAKRWEAIQTTEQMKSKIANSSFKELEIIRSESAAKLMILDEQQRQTVEESIDKQVRLLTEKEKVFLEALDTADDGSELNNTYADLTELADLGYVRMAELDNKMTSRSQQAHSPASSLNKNRSYYFKAMDTGSKNQDLINESSRMTNRTQDMTF